LFLLRFVILSFISIGSTEKSEFLTATPPDGSKHGIGDSLFISGITVKDLPEIFSSRKRSNVADSIRLSLRF
jgi:hypothetical protein